MTFEECCKLIGAWADGEPLISHVWVFGSRFRGDHRPDSDLDIALALNSSVDDMESDYINNAARWRETLSSHLHLLVKTHPAYRLQIQEYLQKGSKLIFERQAKV